MHWKTHTQGCALRSNKNYGYGCRKYIDELINLSRPKILQSIYMHICAIIRSQNKLSQERSFLL